MFSNSVRLLYLRTGQHYGGFFMFGIERLKQKCASWSTQVVEEKKTHIFFWIYMYMYDFIILPWLNSKSLIDNCFNPSEKIEFVTFKKPTFIHHLSTFKRFCTTTLHCCGMWFLRTLITCIKHRNLRLSSEHDKTNKVWWHLKSIIDVGEN